MSTAQPYICPLCDYVLGAFDADCPRCHGKGLPSKTPSGVSTATATPGNAIPDSNLRSPTPSVPPASPVSFNNSVPYLRSLEAKEEEEEAGVPAWFKWGAVTLGLLLALAGIGGYRYWMTTPQYSLLQVKNSFNAHDLPRFEQYLAIDSCADALAADVFQMTQAEMNKSAAVEGETSDLTGGGFGAAFMKGMMASYQTVMAKALKDGARKIVAEGIDSMDGSDSEANSLWESTKATFEDKKFSYQGIGNVTINGEKCAMKLNFYSDETHQLYPITLQMQRHEGHWQITRWENAQTFLTRIGASFN